MMIMHNLTFIHSMEHEVNSICRILFINYMAPINILIWWHTSAYCCILYESCFQMHEVLSTYNTLCEWQDIYVNICSVMIISFMLTLFHDNMKQILVELEYQYNLLPGRHI